MPVYESTEEKPTNHVLYLRQMEMLKMFLERGAISQAQYDRSTAELTQHMKPDTE
ncbi:MAG: hypothetical protein PHE09_03375 [Oscillospiraceae bacterium]|nr:hypothetical protein [Oscillospiraceae bacterium]